MTGYVKFFIAEKGYGFIAPSDGGKDVFFHARAIQGAEESMIVADTPVTFETGHDRNGRLRAASVRLEWQ